jgi:thymidylate synthase
MFLGVPFNQVAAGLWVHALAQTSNLDVGEVVHVIGDAHIYLNHLDQVDEALAREPRPFPKLIMNGEVKDIFAFKDSDFSLANYDAHPHIAAPVAV